jgi:hypothetical protein
MSFSKRLLPILALLCFAWPSHAFIAHDANSHSSETAAATVSWTHTTGSLTNGILILGADFAGLNTATSASGTYAGQPLTQIGFFTGYNGYRKIWLGYIINPASGSNTASVTFAGSSGTVATFGIGVTFSGVNQTTPIDSSLVTNTSSSSASVSLNITTINANAWIVDFYDNYTTSSVTPSPTSPQVDIYHLPNFGVGPGNDGVGMSYQGPVVTPASTSDGWSATGTGAAALSWALGAFSLNPAVAATNTLAQAQSVGFFDTTEVIGY